MTVSFDADLTYLPDREAVLLRGSAGGRRFAALVPWELLVDRFGASGQAVEGEALLLCEANRAELEALVRGRLAAGAPRSGFVSLR